MEHTILDIGGMTCDGCVRGVERRLKSVKGVKSAAVDLQAHSADVDFEAGATTPAELAAAVEKLGYSARVK